MNRPALARRNVDMQLFSLLMNASLSITASWHARSGPGINRIFLFCETGYRKPYHLAVINILKTIYSFNFAKGDCISWLSFPPASLELAIAGRRKAKKEISKKSLAQTWFSRNQYRALSCEIIKPLSQFELISRQGRPVNPVLKKAES